MKTFLRFSTSLLAIQAAAGFALASNGARQIDMLIVAERADSEVKPVLPTPEQPAYYVALDGGYIEAGDPIAGENPASAAEMNRTLRETFAAQNFQPATVGLPSVLLVYHWGVIRRDSHEIRNPNKIPPNQHARLSLVGTAREAGTAENFLLARKSAPLHPDYPSPGFQTADVRNTMDLARDARYFVIVSAFDYAAISRHEAKLLWRVKVSTLSTSGSMSNVLPALLRGAGPYLGRTLARVGTGKAELLSAEPTGPVATLPEFLPSPELAGQLNDPFIHGLVKQEHDEFSGERVPNNR